MIFRNHGTLAVGETVGEAFLKIYFLERACAAQVKALSAGEGQSQQSAAGDARGRRRNRGKASLKIGANMLAWPALLRKAYRLDPELLDLTHWAWSAGSFRLVSPSLLALVPRAAADLRLPRSCGDRSVRRRAVTVHGRVRVQEHGLVNLYAADRQQCIGLLVTDRDRPNYRERKGRIVSVIGRLHAQGCGREGLCDDHLCGPAILRDVELL